MMFVILYWLIDWLINFQGYSYIAPSVLFSENVVSDEIFQPSADKRPNSANILSCKFRVSENIYLH